MKAKSLSLKNFNAACDGSMRVESDTCQSSSISATSEHSGWQYNKMTGKLLRQYVIDELDFDPSFDSANVGVAVENGVAT
jgi:hypothetical protein